MSRLFHYGRKLLQARRSAPNTRTPEPFVFSHVVLSTNIQLDDFSATLASILERLDIEEPVGREWAMMTVVNIGALLEYGHQQGLLRNRRTRSNEL